MPPLPLLLLILLGWQCLKKIFYPIALSLGIDMQWFAILIAMNLQTSKAMAVFYKIVKLVKNGVLMIIHIYAKVSSICSGSLF
jgi:TRAP-type mannitol/chloroaromatic compound transport system permease large subunit